MRKLFFLLFLISYVHLQGYPAKNGVNYYVNPESRSLVEDGSREHPYKSLSKLEQVTWGKGDTLFLAGGVEHRGTLSIEGVKAEKSRPFVITSYGTGNAILHAGKGTGILIANSEHVDVHDLIIYGNGYREEDANNGSGLHCKDCRFVTVDRLECYGFLWNGLFIEGGSDYRVTRVYAHENGYCGILVTAPDSKNRTRNVHISSCIAENNPGCYRITDNHSGSGILLGQVTSATVEYCEAMNNGWAMPRGGNGPVGIWAYEADCITIQYCYSHDNKTSASGKDGGGFDFDGGITNSVLQYNLSMNNEGAGYGLFQYGGGGVWNNNEIRYNISIDDGSKNSHAGIFVWCEESYTSEPLRNTRVYGNKIISSYGGAVHFETGYSQGLRFENNRFCLTNGGKCYITGDHTKNDACFRKNIFWSAGNVIQPEESLDSEAIYLPVRWEKPEKVNVKELKSLIEELLDIP